MHKRGLQQSGLCVRLSGKDKFLRLLTPAGYGTYLLYMTKLMLGLKHVDFSQNVWVENYDNKYLSLRS